MQRPRDLHDYATLAAVRRRRGLALRDELREASSEHSRCLEKLADAESALQTHVEQRDGYAQKLVERTSCGRPVQLEDLQSARGHLAALEKHRAQAYEHVCACAAAVTQAMAACQAVRDRIATNDARIDSLDTQVLTWKRAAAVAAEDREEDERGDIRRMPP